MLAAAALACGAALLLAPIAAWAGGVRGHVSLPSDLKSGRRYPGYWRVDNGNVPVQPPPHRGETAVVVTGLSGKAPSAKTVTIDINGLQATPALVILGPGSVVELKNGGKIAHDLSTPAHPSLMPLQRLAPGAMRRQRFNEAGAYVIRCSEYPHVAVSVLVVDTPHAAVVDEKGNFKLDTSDGKGTLKVWSHGRWIHQEEVEIAGKTVEVDVKPVAGGARESAE